MAPLAPYQRGYKTAPVLAGDKNVGCNTTAPHTNSQAHVGVLALRVECTRQEWSCGGCLQFKVKGGQCTGSGRTTKTQGIYVTCGRSSCIGDSPSALAPNPPAATVIQRKMATTPVAAAAVATAMRRRFAHRRLRVLETRWTTSPERRFPPLTNRLPSRVRSGNLSAAQSLAATHALVVFKSLLLVVVAIPADLCAPNAAELRPPWPTPLACH